MQTQHQQGPLPSTQLNTKYPSSILFPPPPCYCSHRMKNNQSLETIQDFGGGQKNTRYAFPSFFSVCFSLFSSSSKSKIINHLPADKISRSMGEQLQHLVGSRDEVGSKFIPLPASPGLIQSIASFLPNITHMQLE